MTVQCCAPSAVHQAFAVEARATAMFFVSCDADPGVLPRLIEPFAKLGLVPHRVHASREDGDGSVQHVDLRARDLDARTAHLLDKMIRSVVGVRSVISATN